MKGLPDHYAYIELYADWEPLQLRRPLQKAVMTMHDPDNKYVQFIVRLMDPDWEAKVAQCYHSFVKHRTIQEWRARTREQPESPDVEYDASAYARMQWTLLRNPDYPAWRKQPWRLVSLLKAHEHEHRALPHLVDIMAYLNICQWDDDPAVRVIERYDHPKALFVVKRGMLLPQDREKLKTIQGVAYEYPPLS